LEMFSYWACTSITVSDRWSIKKDHWVLCPVLELLRKVTVVNMASNRCHFKVSNVSLKMSSKCVNRNSFSWSRFLLEILAA
jgi:hypothetical protein